MNKDEILKALKARLEPKRKPFDPDGEGYDSETASRLGMKPNADGHMFSVVPLSKDEIPDGMPIDTSLVLKGMSHPTMQLEIDATPDREIVKGPNGRWYSIKR